MIKTVGKLIEELQKHPADMPVGVYVAEAEEGGAFVTKVVVQSSKDRESILYHKGDNPLDTHDDLEEMLTICSRI